MGNVKGFLIGYVVVYFVVAIGINVVMGPPGMSKGYLNTGNNKSDHDHFIEIEKDKVFKRYTQRPNTIENTPSAELEHMIEFYEEYEARPEFQAEMARRGKYNLLFEFFNSAMVVVLLVRFGRKPIANAIDGLVASVKERMERVEGEAAAASAEKKAAQEQLRALPAELEKLTGQTDDRIAAMRQEAAMSGAQRLVAIQKETEDRKRTEEARARRALKEALVDVALADLKQQIENESSNETQNALVDQFVDRIERGEVTSS